MTSAELASPSQLVLGLPSGILEGLTLRQSLRDEHRTFSIIAAVQNARVLWISAPIDTGCARVHMRIRVRAGREVPGCAIIGFKPNLRVRLGSEAEI